MMMYVYVYTGGLGDEDSSISSSPGASQAPLSPKPTNSKSTVRAVGSHEVTWHGLLGHRTQAMGHIAWTIGSHDTGYI